MGIMSLGVFTWYLRLFLESLEKGDYEECELIDCVMIGRGGTTLSQVFYGGSDE